MRGVIGGRGVFMCEMDAAEHGCMDKRDNGITE